jgi:hypothetical protein
MFIVCTYVSITHFLLSNINFYCTVHVYVVSHFYYCNGHFMLKWICECFFLLFVYIYVLQYKQPPLVSNNWTQKKTRCGIGNPGPVLGQAQTCVRIKKMESSKQFFLVFNYIFLYLVVTKYLWQVYMNGDKNVNEK